MSELVDMYILHKKKKRKNATKNWPSQFHGWTPASSFPRSTTSSASLCSRSNPNAAKNSDAALCFLRKPISDNRNLIFKYPESTEFSFL